MKSAIFIHVALIGRYIERLTQYLNLINTSDLYNNVEYIYICCVGNNVFKFDYTKYDKDNKVNIIYVSTILEDFELPTQQYMYNFCKDHPNYNILYLHTKGVHIEINLCIEDWVSYMIHFCINKWKTCVSELETNVSVGVDLRDIPTLHYSGNFWWATSNHIVSLPEPYDFSNIQKYPNPINSPRHNQEFWICYDKQIRNHACLWESNIDCFQRHLHRYNEDKYI